MDPYRTMDELMDARHKALISGNVEQMREYIIRSGEPAAMYADVRVIEMSMHKARVHWRNCPPELLHESVWWLLDHHCSLMLNEVGQRYE